MNNKRNLVILALGVISILLLVILTVAPTSAQDTSMDKLYGSWNVEVAVVAQGETFPALITFGDEGWVIADEPPQAGETSGHGNWIATGDGGVAFTFESLFSGEDGTYNGRLKVIGTLQYDAATNTWQGPFKIALFDKAGQVTFSDTGTFSLTRLVVESLE